jgi:hypothetical protein
VLIDGEPLATIQFPTVSDTAITVVAADTFGFFLPVVVQTSQGVSNDNVTIEILGIPSSLARVAGLRVDELFPLSMQLVAK